MHTRRLTPTHKLEAEADEEASDASNVELTTKAIQKAAVGEKAAQTRVTAAASKRKVTGPQRVHGVCACDGSLGDFIDFPTS